MPTRNWRPSVHVPIGYASPVFEQTSKYHDDQEDKPTVKVDPFARGMEAGLIEAVCLALELWEPTFIRYDEPPAPTRPKDGSEPYEPRLIPVFRGRHADRVRKFRNDIVQYTQAHRVEPSKNEIIRIASKYVHIRVIPRQGSKDPFGHPDLTPYRREVIRPHVRRSDQEWNPQLVRQARQGLRYDNVHIAHECVLAMLERYDENHATVLAVSYAAECHALVEDHAPDWEHWRLVSYFVQDIVDSQVPTTIPARKTTTKRKVTT